MAPKRLISGENKPKRKTVVTTIELKKELIAKYEKGARITDIATEYGMAKSTVATILKKKEAIKSIDVSFGVKSQVRRPQAVEQVEKLLMLWINERQMAGDSMSEGIICAKARRLYSDLISESDKYDSSEEFKASKGWFANFKRRSGIHSVARHGEAASADKVAADKYVVDFQKFVDSEGLTPQQVFNGDETGLFWKKLPNRTYITKEEKTMPGHKPMKDRLTLLLCANASGDCKIKPLLVYHSENPRAFKQNGVQKNKLAVMWRANKKAWTTRQIFTEWFLEVFAPAVKAYLLKNNLPLKALLLLDNAPAHPPGVEEELGEEYDFIQVRFLPPNTTPLIQPMDQNVIATFKRLYTKALFERCFEVTSATQLTLREFWRNHFHILHCLRMIEKAWSCVSVRVLQAAWKNMWPSCVSAKDSEGFEPLVQDSALVDDIVVLGRDLGLEVDCDDVEELVAEHSQDLTTDELRTLHEEQLREVTEELSSGEEEGNSKERASTAEIKNVLRMWTEVGNFCEKHHPDLAAVHRNLNSFDENMMQHFRHAIKKRQKQITLDRFFVKKDSSQSASVGEPEPSTSGFKPGEELPEAMEGDSSSSE